MPDHEELEQILEGHTEKPVYPCTNCKARKFFAKKFDMHFSGEDCWYMCDLYEEYKQKGGTNR